MKQQLIIGLLIVTAFLACKKPVVVDNLPVPIPPSFSKTFYQPGYPPVYANVDVPQAALDAIRDGVAKQIRLSSAKFPLWVAVRHPDDYQIFLIDPQATNVETDPGSPALIVHPPNGIGSIQACGTVIGVGNDHNGFPTLVMPHQVDSNWTHLPYLSSCSRNESEHLAGWANDQAWFWSWYGPNDVHPEWPDENGQ